MTLPLAGSILAGVLSVERLSIHGDVYFDLHLLADGAPPDRPLRVRVPLHALDGGQPPPEGRRVRLTFLMQQVTRCELLD
ncbi:MAG: hypothetical protein ACK51N_06760 [bacterium]|jgi:hypothetical protein|nr:hypothetical protein [Phycisphaerales bacterium]MCE2654335.1 hypothetical protein [Planctomycetaceae bacterium]